MSVVPAASFKDRLAEKRRQLVARNSFELPVPGYEGLYARYRILGYDDIRTIGLRNEETAASVSEGERSTAAEVLGEACLGLLEKTGTDENGKPCYEELGYRWGVRAAEELFGVEGLPEDVSPRVAVQSIFPYPHDMLMMTHFQDYVVESDVGIGVLEQRLMGESSASSVTT